MASRDRLDKVVAEMIAETEALQPAERLVRQTMYGAGPKWLIEQLYYVSITEQTGTAKFINMAQNVLNTRYFCLDFTSPVRTLTLFPPAHSQTCPGSDRVQDFSGAKLGLAKILQDDKGTS